MSPNINSSSYIDFTLLSSKTNATIKMSSKKKAFHPIHSTAALTKEWIKLKILLIVSKIFQCVQISRRNSRRNPLGFHAHWCDVKLRTIHTESKRQNINYLLWIKCCMIPSRNIGTALTQSLKLTVETCWAPEIEHSHPFWGQKNWWKFNCVWMKCYGKHF